MGKYGYVDVDKLIEYANNCRVGLDANDIARFPKADVRENVRGEWIDYEYSDFCKCSECLRVSSAYWNYCPSCGADMRTSKDS